MLVLTRKKGQSIRLIVDGQQIAKIVYVKQVNGNCRLGVEAGEDVLILRTEVKDREGTDNEQPGD